MRASGPGSLKDHHSILFVPLPPLLDPLGSSGWALRIWILDFPYWREDGMALDLPEGLQRRCVSVPWRPCSKNCWNTAEKNFLSRCWPCGVGQGRSHVDIRFWLYLRFESMRIRQLLLLQWACSKFCWLWWWWLRLCGCLCKFPNRRPCLSLARLWGYLPLVPFCTCWTSEKIDKAIERDKLCSTVAHASPDLVAVREQDFD